MTLRSPPKSSSTVSPTPEVRATGLPNRRRIDARLAYPFRIGDTRMEAAVTAQAANGNYPDYLMNRGFEFERRAFGTLHIEF